MAKKSDGARKPKRRADGHHGPSLREAAPDERGVRIVGMGASAGGLEAIEKFFAHMPPDADIAFAVVQHLDPTAHSSMPEILSRFTKMPIQVAFEGVAVEPNSIYLAPPNKSMRMEGGTLCLEEQVRAPGLRLPIDSFLRSLAREKGPDAICVIFSGTGTDGTLGVKAIKAEGGTVVVQDPDSAKYDGMPRSAIETGLADLVLAPEDMPAKLVQFVKHPAINGKIAGGAPESREPLQQIFAILRTRTGHDFSRYKLSTVRRRLQRRMSVNQITEVSAYAAFLKETEDEVKALLKDLLISVTSFFRDSEAFEALKAEIKGLIKSRASGSDLRIWVAGCATGEEAYSVAIVVSECLTEMKKRLRVQLYGTDIDIDALHVARAGNYPANVAADITPERLKDFFVKENNTYRIRKEIRAMAVFAPQNFTKDPPFSRMDLICSRNLLIYLDGEEQKRLLPLLHYALKPGGLLFLGTSETVGEATDLFAAVDRKWKIYQRREVRVSADKLRFPAAFAPGLRETADRPAGESLTRIPELSERIFLDNYAPTFAVIDEKHRLVYVRGRTGKYLEIASGQPSLSVLEMAREGLKSELASAVYRAASEMRTVVSEGIHIRYNGSVQTINLTVAPLTEPGMPTGFLIVVFNEVALATGIGVTKPAQKGHRRLNELEEELKLTKGNLQTTIEELEATNEELKSANEELQSNNEELQSTNEELDTSREELQSLNEELTTLNAELQDKNEMLVSANDDLRNLLNRTDIAIIFLDDDLKIRNFTPATTDLFAMRDIDVGRPLEEISSRLAYEHVGSDAQEVLATLRSRETEVQLKDGRWYNMRIQPYLTAQKVVSGLVLSFLNINRQKTAAAEAAEANLKLQAALQEIVQNRNGLATVIETVPVGVMLMSKPDGKVALCNKEVTRIFGEDPHGLDFETFAGKITMSRTDGTRCTPRELSNSLRLLSDLAVLNTELAIERSDGSRIFVLCSAAPVRDAHGNVTATAGVFRDITEYKQAEKIKDDFIGMVSHELRTPITVVTGAIKTATDPRVSSEDRSLLLKEANTSAESLARILDNLLELTRYQTGRLVLEKKSTNIAAVVDGTLKALRSRYPAREVLQDTVGVPEVFVDPVRLEGIIFNLADNALKYSDEKSEVRILCRQEGETVVVSVIDHGKGISEKDQKKLFEPFGRLEPARAKGIGLGLVVCKRLVEAHGGRIWVESREGEGCTFRFTIPPEREEGTRAVE